MNSYISKGLIRHEKLTKLKRPMSAPSDNYMSRKQLAVVREYLLVKMPARWLGNSSDTTSVHVTCGEVGISVRQLFPWYIIGSLSLLDRYLLASHQEVSYKSLFLKTSWHMPISVQCQLLHKGWAALISTHESAKYHAQNLNPVAALVIRIVWWCYPFVNRGKVLQG